MKMVKAFTHLRFKPDRTQKKVIVYILSITLPLFLFSLYFIQETASRELARFSQEKASRLDSNITAEIKHYLDHASSFTKEASHMLRLNPGNFAAILPFLKQHVRNDPNIYGSALALEPASALKKIYCKYFYKHHTGVEEKWLMPPAYNYLQKEWYTRTRHYPEGTWSKPYFDKNGGNVFMSTFSYPVTDRNRSFMGVITADVKVDTLSRKIQKMMTPKEGFVLILDQNGLILSHPDEKYALKKTVFAYAEDINAPALSRVLQSILTADRGIYSVKIYNETYTLYSSTIPNSRLKIAVFLRNTLLYKPLTDLKHKLLILALAGIGLILFMMIVILREFKQDIVKKTKLKNELALAKKIQLGFLPEKRAFNTSGYRLKTYLKAAREVGGDLYGYKELNHGIVFYVGDVSGKGIPAALFMMATQIVLKNALDTTTDPAEIVSMTNTKLLEISKSGMFVTLLVIKYDFITQTLTFCNAGHPPFIIKTDRLFSPLGSIHPPVSTFAQTEYHNTLLTLKAPFGLICFSDGVTEAENSRQELFGTERIARSLAQHFLLHELCLQIDLFTAETPQNDDITILTFHSEKPMLKDLQENEV